MVEKNILDNLTCQEIKEMIYNQEISIDELDTSALYNLLDYETDMLSSGGGDMQLIRKCAELLDKANGEPLLSEEEMTEIIDNTKAEYVTIVSEKSESDDIKNHRRKRFILKRALIVAAVITVLLSVAAIVSTAFGYDPWNNIFDGMTMIASMPYGSEINTDKVTYFNAGQPIEYSSIEELIQKENIDIMYPSKFPEGIKLDRIRKKIDERGIVDISLITDNAHTVISINLNADPLDGNAEDCVPYEYNGLTYYIYYDAQFNKTYYAFCHYKNNYYCIEAQNYDDLILIINNMKE